MKILSILRQLKRSIKIGENRSHDDLERRQLMNDEQSVYPVGSKLEQITDVQANFPGLIDDFTIALWDALLCFQNSIGIAGNMMEIGVYRGRSAMVAGLHLDPAHRILLIDADLKSHNTTEHLHKLLGDRALWMNKNSYDLRVDDFIDFKRSCSWVHIDGEHTGRAVLNDMAFGDHMLSDTGLLVLDNYFNPTYPQITEAAIAYLAQNRYRLSLVLCGWNKAYYARPMAADIYRRFFLNSLAQELHGRYVHDFVISKTASIDESTSFGIFNRWIDRDYYGLDADPDTLPLLIDRGTHHIDTQTVSGKEPIAGPPGSDKRPIADINSFFEDIAVRGFEPRGIIDVGANFGRWTRMARSFFPNARVIMIEPQAEAQGSLDALCDELEGIEKIQAGAGSKKGELVQTIWDDLQGSSFLPEIKEEELKNGRQRITPIITIDDITKDRGDFHPDLVKLDLQGFELEALKGASSLFGRTQLFILETSLYEFIPGWPRMIDCINFMSERGYEIYDITEYLRRPSDGALGQVDLVFAMRDGEFRKSNSW